MSIRICLPHDLWCHAKDFGERSVGGYQDGRKSTAQSTHGISSDPIRQAEARMGECAVSLWGWRNPRTALDWSPHPDGGHDLVLNGMKIDVKQTRPYGRLLVWPWNKVADLPGKDFDLFVLTKCEFSNPWVTIVGWIGKPEFIAIHKVAGPGHRLAEGDLYVDQSQLHAMWAASVEKSA